MKKRRKWKLPRKAKKPDRRRPAVQYGKMIDFGEFFGTAVLQRIGALPPSEIENADRAYRGLVEYHGRLSLRFNDLLVAEHEVQFFDDPPPGYSLHEAHMRFVSAFEAMHQHIYAALAALAQLLSHVVPSSATTPPTRSIKAFLSFLAGRVAGYADELALLERSRDYRARYVDHPQKPPQDWYTMRPAEAEGEVFIIYFPRPAEGGVAVFAPGPENLDPRRPDFRPALGIDKWLVAPSAREAYVALLHLTRQVLSGELWDVAPNAAAPES